MSVARRLWQWFPVSAALIAMVSAVSCSSSSDGRNAADEAGGSGGGNGQTSGGIPSGGSSGSGGSDASGGSNTGGVVEPGGAGGAASGAGGAGGAAPADLCEQYCEIVAANCVDAHAVYTSRDTCLAVCATLPEGTPGDEIGNTLQCRLMNAELAGATGEPEVHCPAAGPGGGDVCGTNCEGYCVIMAQACEARFGQLWAGLAECHAQCGETIPDLGGYNIEQNAGDSVNCRLWHVSAASVAPSTHCGHASGEAPCS